MKIKKNSAKIFVIFIFLLASLMMQCTGAIRIDLHSVKEWIERKPFPIRVTFNNVEKISNVMLYYSFNNQPTASTSLSQQGQDFTYTIPGGEVVPGYLDYYIMFDHDGEENSSNNVHVKILTIEEAIAKFEKELYNRLSHNPPKEVAFNKNVELVLSVSAAKSSTEVKFYYKNPQQNNFKEVQLSGSNGKYKYTIKKDELKEEYNTYYYKVNEDHPDVGGLEVFLPQNGESNPFTFKILGADELREKMKVELYKSVAHTVPKDVYVINDLEIKVAIKYPSGSFIKDLSKNKLNISLYYGKEGTLSSFKKASMSKYQNNIFAYVIQSSDLKKGYNAYYFEISEDTEDVGIVQTIYPKGGENSPLVYNILSIEEIKIIMEKELYKRISHTPIKEVDGISELPIEIKVKNASNKTQAYLHIKKSSQSNYRTVTMSRYSETFTSIISIEDQQNGYTQYYFTVTEFVQEIGELSIDYQKNGASNPFKYTVLDINEVKDRLEKDLFSRFKHTPVTQAAEGQTLELTAKIENMINGTEVYLYHRKSGETSYRQTKAHRSGNTFTATISKSDIRNGYNQYYLEAKEPHHYFGYIKSTKPKSGPASPYQFEIITLRDSIFNSAEFTPLEDVDYGTSVNVTIKFGNIISGMKVYLKYRISGESQYHTLDMNRDGNIYSVKMSQSFLQEGKRIDYYFLITIESENIEFTYPSENLIPLSFLVRKQEQQVNYYTVKYNISPTGAGTIVLTPEASNGKYVENSGVIITAAANEGYSFDHWEGDLTGSENPTVITMNSNKNITAVFKEIETGEETPFGNTEKTEENMLEGRIYKLPEGTSKLPTSLHTEYEALKVIYTRTIDIPTRKFTEGFPGLENVFEWFAIQYRGLIVIKEAGEYKFKLKSDDGSKLYIDSELVIDNDGTHGPKAANGKITLSVGTYPIRIDYFQGPRDQIALQLFVKKPKGGEKLFDLADFE